MNAVSLQEVILAVAESLATENPLSMPVQCANSSQDADIVWKILSSV
jgi:hypothetical protein